MYQRGNPNYQFIATLGIFLLQVNVLPGVHGESVTMSAMAEIRQVGSGKGVDNGEEGNKFSSGIRQYTGASNGTSTLYLNVEGSNHGRFTTFAVLDFSLPTLPYTLGVRAARLILHEDPATFAAAGPVEVYLLTNNSPNLISVVANPAEGVPGYQANKNQWEAIDPHFSPRPARLGLAQFEPTGAGNQTIIELQFTNGEQAEFVDRLRAGETLRLALVPGDASVAATFAGTGNQDGAPPRLDFTPVMLSPIIVIAVVVGLLGIAVMAWKFLTRSSKR